VFGLRSAKAPSPLTLVDQPPPAVRGNFIGCRVKRLSAGTAFALPYNLASSPRDLGGRLKITMSLAVLVGALSPLGNSMLIAQESVAVSAHKPFHASAQSKFAKACGSGIDEHTKCGLCVRIGSNEGPAVTAVATCDHICVQLPAGKTASDVNVVAYAANDRLAPSWLLCGNSTNAPAMCSVGYAHFEGVEYYKDTNKICGRFKNWSSDQARIFRIDVNEK
jgi:hypothetical protein